MELQSQHFFPLLWKGVLWLLTPPPPLHSRGFFMTDEIPLCPICEAPCKPCPSGTGTVHPYFYVTCGKPECKRDVQKRNKVPFTSGKQFKRPKIASWDSVVKQSLICHRCKGPKELGKRCCENCRITLKKKKKNDHLFTHFKKDQIVLSDEKAFKLRQRDQAVSDFDELTRQARLLLKKP